MPDLTQTIAGLYIGWNKSLREASSQDEKAKCLGAKVALSTLAHEMGCLNEVRAAVDAADKR